MDFKSQILHFSELIFTIKNQSMLSENGFLYRLIILWLIELHLVLKHVLYLNTPKNLIF